MKIESLFPTPVGMFDMSRKITEEQNRFVEECSKNVNKNLGNRNSLNYAVLEDDSFSEIKREVQLCLDEYFNEVYKPKNDVKLKITQSWLNYTTKGENHHKHGHPNSFVSGVLYINTNENDKIYFHQPSGLMREMQIEANSFNLWNSSTWYFNVKNGMLLLFPSNLVHHVDFVNDENHTRISLAFNTFLVGEIGNEFNLTRLIIEESGIHALNRA